MDNNDDLFSPENIKKMTRKPGTYPPRENEEIADRRLPIADLNAEDSESEIGNQKSEIKNVEIEPQISQINADEERAESESLIKNHQSETAMQNRR